MKEAFEKLTEQEKQAFWEWLKQAVLWRGWDRRCQCHACDFIRSFADLLLKHNGELEEYT